MPEYIRKEQAIDEVWDAITMRDDPELGRVIEENIERVPAADVAPVVHGKWLTPKALIECSECGFGMFPDGYYFDHGECAHANESWFRPNYCPHCGARMDGGENE